MTPIEVLEKDKFLKKKEDLRQEMEDIEFKYEQLMDNMLVRVQEINPRITAISDMWDCSESPIGVCAYDEDDDPARDNCVFCHDPEERK